MEYHGYYTMAMAMVLCGGTVVYFGAGFTGIIHVVCFDALTHTKANPCTGVLLGIMQERKLPVHLFTEPC